MLTNEKSNVAAFSAVLVLAACQKEMVEQPQQVRLEPQLSTQDVFWNGIYKDYYDYFLAERLGDLSSTPMYFNVEGYTIHRYESLSKHYANPNVTSANLIAFIASSGQITTVVQDYSQLVFSDGIASGGHISIRLVNGLEIYKIQKNSNGKWILEDGVDLSLLPTTSEGINGWWECTAKCYAFAKSACAGDPACDLLCDLANIAGSLCTIEIGVACGIHCAINNGTFNPPTALEALSVLDPYGFGI